MTNFLFWNFNQPNQEEILASTAIGHDIDIILLAECKASDSDLLEILNRRETRYHLPANLNHRFRILTRFPGELLQPWEDHERMTVRRLLLPDKKDILLAVIHFYDRRNYKPADLDFLTGVLQSQFSPNWATT